MRLLACSIAVAALVVSWTGAAEAHAFLRHAVPLVGSTIPTAPPELTLDYTEGVEPRFSSVVVQDAQGQRVDKDDLHVAPSDGKRLVIGLQPLKPGTYKVQWHVTSVDTHRTDGGFSFSVQP
jgi:methionine-rich copper-binding protein CopC